MIAPITVLGSAAAALCVFWPAGAQLLIRFTGPELWWVLRVAQWPAGVPGATVPVPAGVPGVLVVGGATALVLLLWRCAPVSHRGRARPGGPGPVRPWPGRSPSGSILPAE